MILGNRRNCIHDDVRVRVAGLNGLYECGIVGDKIANLHTGIVGAEGHDDPARFHLRDGLRDSIGVAVLFKGHDALIQSRLGADALFRAELLQGDQAIVIQADGVGITQKQHIVQVVVTGIGGFGQESGRRFVDLIMVGQVIVRGFFLTGSSTRRRSFRLFAALEEGQRDADGQQSGQCADDADQNGLFLH